MIIQLCVRVGEKKNFFELNRISLSKKQRVLSSLKIAFIGFLFSLLVALVPIVHFFLVPIGVILTVFLAYSSYKVKNYIAEGTCICPACSGVIKIYHRAEQLPFDDVCESCHRKVVIEEKN